MVDKKYRLVTRADFDGAVCAVLLKHLNLIDNIIFAHPKDMQDGNVDIRRDDIITNLPYVEDAHLVFDHHVSEALRNDETKDNYVINSKAPSAARVLYNYYGGRDKFANDFEDMMRAVDKSDTAQFTKEDILNPKGWELLNFIMDSRTGLGRFKNFRISDYRLLMDLIDYCKDYSIEEIMELEDIKERVDLYFKYEDDFKEQIKKCTKVYDNIAVFDIRDEDVVYPGNRFMIYALYPQIDIAMHIFWGINKKSTVFSVGKSIFNRTSKANIGKIMLEYGGGGHKAIGTCQVSNEKNEEVFKELLDRFSN